MPLVPARERNPLLQTFIVDALGGALMNVHFEGGPMNPSDFAVASILRLYGPITPTELSGLLGLAPTTLSSRLRRLEKRREVRRKPNPRDGRSYLIQVTALGRRRVEAMFPAFRATLEAIRRHLGDDDSRQVMDGLARLEEALRAAITEARAAV